MIKDHIEAIQQEFQEKYGVGAEVEICINPIKNNNLTEDKLRNVVVDLADEYGMNVPGDGLNGVRVIEREKDIWHQFD